MTLFGLKFRSSEGKPFRPTLAEDDPKTNKILLKLAVKLIIKFKYSLQVQDRERCATALRTMHDYFVDQFFVPERWEEIHNPAQQYHNPLSQRVSDNVNLLLQNQDINHQVLKDLIKRNDFKLNEIKSNNDEILVKVKKINQILQKPQATPPPQSLNFHVLFFRLSKFTS